MNPLTNVKNVLKLSQQELHSTGKSSWHDQYKDSAWLFIGGLPYDLTEGDIICIFSQYGEVVNINLIRAKDTGKSKGFCFLCYEDQRSTILAVDNFNGIKILNRTIRVDHVQDYKVPKDDKKATEETKKLYAEGCAPKAVALSLPKRELPDDNLRETLADQIQGDIKLPQRLPIYTNIKGEKISDNEMDMSVKKKKKKDKKKKSKKKSKKSESTSDDSGSSPSENEARVKKERMSSEERNKYRDKKSDRGRDESGNRHGLKYSSEKGDYLGKNSYKAGNSSKRDRSRSRSRDRDQKTKCHKRDVSPNIPKRWR